MQNLSAVPLLSTEGGAKPFCDCPTEHRKHLSVPRAAGGLPIAPVWHQGKRGTRVFHIISSTHAAHETPLVVPELLCATGWSVRRDRPLPSNKDFPCCLRGDDTEGGRENVLSYTEHRDHLTGDKTRIRKSHSSALAEVTLR